MIDWENLERLRSNAVLAQHDIRAMLVGRRVVFLYLTAAGRRRTGKITYALGGSRRENQYGIHIGVAVDRVDGRGSLAEDWYGDLSMVEIIDEPGE